MSTIRNQVVLIGNLGKDPEITNFDSGSRNAKFSLATNESYKNESGETITETQWHNIIVWGKRVNLVEKFLKKGNEVCITGKITYRIYEDKEGAKKNITEIKADEIVMFGAKNQPSLTGVADVEHQ